jgi:hypothetical protein
MVRKPGYGSRAPGDPISAGGFEDFAVISATSTLPARVSARIAVIAAMTLLCACSHVQKLWPWHHAPAAPEPPVTELEVVATAGETAPVLAQTWDRNSLRVALDGVAGTGELKLRPVQGHGWPIRLEFAVRPGSFAQLEVRGEQRVIMNVPATGAQAVLAVPQGLYAPRTKELTLRYGS